LTPGKDIFFLSYTALEGQYYFSNPIAQVIGILSISPPLEMISLWLIPLNEYLGLALLKIIKLFVIEHFNW